MKTTSQTLVAVVVIALGLPSCKEDHSEVIAKLDVSQHELQVQDSIVKESLEKLNSFFVPDTTSGNAKIEPMDSLQKALIDNETELQVSLDSLVSKNKLLIASLNEDKMKNKEAEEKLTEIKVQLDAIKLADNVNITEYRKLEEKFNKPLQAPKEKK